MEDRRVFVKKTQRPLSLSLSKQRGLYLYSRDILLNSPTSRNVAYSLNTTILPKKSITVLSINHFKFKFGIRNLIVLSINVAFPMDLKKPNSNLIVVALYLHSTIGNIIAMASLIIDNQDGIARSISDAPPTHYTFKIQSFSLLTKNSVERYDSGDFEAGGYKWKLILYPNGNKSKNVKDHISLYLSMAEVSSLRAGWEVYAVFRLFLLDQNKDCYLTLQDTMGNGRRFHGMKLGWGFDQFISLKAFNDACNGFLVDDTCVLGAEVFVCKEKGRGKGECLSMIKDTIAYKHTWKIENFSKLDAECYDSIAFIAGDHKWKIQMYPKGKGNVKGSYISIYLALADSSTCPPGSKIYADFTLRLLDQMQTKHWVGKVSHWFSPSSSVRGWPRFISFSNFYLSNSGLLIKDTCLVDAEVTILGVAEAL